MSKISNGGLVGLFYNDFNQRQKSGLWSLEDHAADKNYISSSQIPNNYLVVGSYNTNSLYLYDLFFKNKISTNIFNIPVSTITSIDYNYKTNKTVYNKQLALPISKRTFKTDSLAELANTQEKELLRQSATYRNMKSKLSTTWEDVKKHLSNNEVAIEFVKFNALRKNYLE